MSILDDTVWQEVAKWFAGITASIASLLMLALWGRSADRFKAMDERFEAHESIIKKHTQQITEQHEALILLVERVDTGKEDRQKIQASLNSMNAKIDRLVERR